MKREHDASELKAALADALNYFDEAAASNTEYGPRKGSALIAPWPTAPARIVFLDFDGVLNSEISVTRLGTRYRFDTEAIRLINNLCGSAGAYIVVTSTWREHWPLKEVIGFLERDGLHKNQVVGKTPILGTARGEEIDSWLKQSPFEISSFVILDDHDDMEPYRSRWVQINSNIGLQEKEVIEALRILNGSR
jgi:hypothetical protein